MSKESFQTVPETFWRLFAVPGPGDILETFSAFRAQRARETSVRGGLVPKKSYENWKVLSPLCLYIVSLVVILHNRVCDNWVSLKTLTSLNKG